MPKRPRENANDCDSDTITCKDCSIKFVFSAAERATFAAKGFGARVRCADCTKSKRERYAIQADAVAERPVYDTATEARLDAWIEAKRAKMFEQADKMRAALRKDGIDPDAARPVGYDAAAAESERREKSEKKSKAVKCFNCGSKGHFSSQCTQKESGSTACYHCGSEAHKGKDCPMAPAKMSFDPQAARCFACGKQGHVAAACPNPSKKTACHLCGGEGHKARYCPNAKETKAALLPAGFDVEAKKAEWAACRERKDYGKADAIKAELMAAGVNPAKKPK